MTDLTNRTVQEVNELIQTHASLLEHAGAKHQQDIPILAIIIDVCIKYIREKHNDLSANWKAWTVVIVRNKYFDKKIKTEEDIKEIIDNFIDYWKSEYTIYCNDIVAASEYDRDRGFVYRFLLKKIGS